MSDFNITVAEYQEFHDYLEESCGIVLGPNRQYLVTSRLHMLLRHAAIDTLSHLMERLRSGDSRLRIDVIDAMTTNETSWFRDTVPFEVLDRVILEDLYNRKVTDAKFWSAACSSGQEAYSMSMVIEEFMSRRAMALRNSTILATDISTKVLNQARSAVYDEAQLGRGLSAKRRTAHFESFEFGFRVKDKVRSRVRFKEQNLQQEIATPGKFDCIFCRNVLIYFSTAARASIIEHFWSVLKPGGYLLLGGAESPVGSQARFETKIENKYLYYKKK